MVVVVCRQSVCGGDDRCRCGVDSHRSALRRAVSLHPERHQLPRSTRLRHLLTGRVVETN